jgi:hypothetical protein
MHFAFCVIGANRLLSVPSNGDQPLSPVSSDQARPRGRLASPV